MPSLRLPDLSGVTVLVIDDDADSLEVLSTFLKACDATVLIARTATAALAYVDTTPKLDVLVTDLAMPDVDGLQFARRLRQHPTRKLVPLIAVTAFYETYPNSAEFDAWLRKPVDLEQLASLIARLVQRSRPQS